MLALEVLEQALPAFLGFLAQVVINPA